MRPLEDSPLAAAADMPVLRDLQKAFPQFAIWREGTTERTRYIARRAHAGTHPHTVVTADLAELRVILAATSPPQRLDRQRAGFHRAALCIAHSLTASAPTAQP